MAFTRSKLIGTVLAFALVAHSSPSFSIGSGAIPSQGEAGRPAESGEDVAVPHALPALDRCAAEYLSLYTSFYSVLQGRELRWLPLANPDLARKLKACEPTEKDVEFIHGIAFPSIKDGWLVGWRGLIAHTGDGGATWKNQPSGTKDNLQAVSFPTLKTGYAAGFNGTVLRTDDAGKHWRAVSIPASVELGALSCPVVNTCWVGGMDSPAIWATFDGGKSWTRQKTFAEGHISGLQFIDGRTGWAVTLFGEILATKDGGTTWSESHRAKGSLWAVHFPDRDNGWAVGTDGMIVATHDGGRNWSNQASGLMLPKDITADQIDLRAVSFVSPKEGWAAGLLGAVLHTKDGGATWRLKRFEFTADYSIYALSSRMAEPHPVVVVAGNLGNVFVNHDGGIRYLSVRGMELRIRQVFEEFLADKSKRATIHSNIYALERCFNADGSMGAINCAQWLKSVKNAEKGQVRQVTVLMGAKFVDGKDWGEAVLALERAVRLGANEPEVAYLLDLARGRAALKDGKAEDALRRFQAAIAAGAAVTEPGKATARAMAAAAEAELALGRADAALTRLNEAVQRDPTNAEAHVARVSILFDRGDEQAAVDRIKFAVRQAPRSVDPLLDMADKLRRTVPQKDLAISEAVAMEDPTNARAFFIKGRALYELKDYERSIASFDRAIELEGNDDFYYSERGWSKRIYGQDQASLVDFKKAQELNPGSFYTLFNLGVAYYYVEDYDAAIAKLDAALRLRPDARAHYHRGRAFAGKKDWRAAIAAFDLALTIAPKDEDAYRARAAAHLELEQRSQALADIDLALAINPKASDALRLRAEMNWKEGDRPAALADARKAVEVRPDLSANHFLLARFLVLTGAPEEGLREIAVVAGQTSRTAASYNNRCWSKAVLGDADGAIADCRESLRIRPDDRNTEDSLAFAYLKAGKFDQAIELYDRCLAKRPTAASSLMGRGYARVLSGDPGGEADLEAARKLAPELETIFEAYGVKRPSKGTPSL